MYSLFIECPEAEAELLSAELWEEGASGIQEEALPGERCRLRAWFDDPSGLLQRFAPFRPRVEADPDIDWELHSRQAWRPFEVGRRLYLAPEWDESATPVGRVRVTIHPGLALGTGAHPATQLCLHAIDSHVRVGDTVLDLGAGSGILSAAALRLGVRRVFACDIDPDSAATARANLQRDALTAPVFIGSTRAVRSSAVDVVVANINSVTHETLSAEYSRLARRLLVLSGFPDRYVPRIERAMRLEGFRPVDTLARQEWVCLVLSRAADSA
jgi:ribosomal protein L11 methyltransferase